MKRLLLVAAMLIAPAAFAAKHHMHHNAAPRMSVDQQKAAVESYMRDLHAAVAPCTDIAFKNRLDEDLAETKRHIDAQVAIANGRMPEPPQATDLSQSDPWVNCMKDAREKGAARYKDFAASDVSSDLLSDGKKVFVAWLAYISTFGPSEEESPENDEATALREAQATMQTDALIQ